MYLYYVLHNKYGNKTIEAPNTYNACKQYATFYNLKSTSGISAYLMTEKKVADD